MEANPTTITATEVEDDPSLGPANFPIVNFDDSAMSANDWAVLCDLESSGAYDVWDDRSSDAY